MEESWRAWVSVVRNHPDAPKWIQSDNAKFEESIVGYIPKVLADATVGRGRFASDRLRKNEVILLDHGTNAYSGANWNSVMMLNLIAASYLGNFAGNAEKLAYLPDDKGVENVGNVLQKQLFAKYNVDYSEEIGRAVSDIKIYANKLNLYKFISDMCDIKNSKMSAPESADTSKLPDFSNYLAPNCTGWFDGQLQNGGFSFETHISNIHGNAAKYATAHINHGQFLGYALGNWNFVNLDRDMRAIIDCDPQVICTYNLPKYISEISKAATHRIFQYKGKTEFEANCLRQNQVHGLANLGGTCWFNTALQTLHFSPTFRRAISKIVEAVLRDVPKDKLTQTKDSSMSYQLLRLFELIETGKGADRNTLEERVNSFKSATRNVKIDIEPDCDDEEEFEEDCSCVSRLFDEKPHDAFEDGVLSLFCINHERNPRSSDEFLYTSLLCIRKIALCSANTHVLPIENSDIMSSYDLLALHGNDGDNLQSHLQSFFGNTNIGSYDRVCPYCEDRKFFWHNDLAKLPECLIVDIGSIKTKRVSAYPEELLLRDKESVKTYQLVSAGIHNGGHWWAEGRLDSGKWLTVDDVAVGSPRPFSQNPNAKFLIYEQM